MKKLKNYLPFILFFLLVSCEREVSKEVAENRNDNNLKAAVSTIVQFKSSPTSIIDLLKYPEDKENEKIFMQVYEIAGGFCKVAQTSELLSIIYSNLDTSNKKNEVDVDALISINNTIKEQIELFTTHNDNSNTYEKVKSKLLYKNMSFIPVIYIPNAQTADFSKSPVIAIGTDFSWHNDDFEDYIPGWEIQSNTKLREIVLGEHDALKSQCPVIILTIKSATDIKKVVNNNIGYMATTSFQQPYAREYMILHRYDRSNNSEYRYTEKIYNTDGTNYVDQETITDIHKSDMGHLFTGGTVSINSELNTYYTYLATFEYDWYASKKTIGVTGINGLQWLEARMSFPSEYYQRIVWDWRYAVPPFVSTSPEGIIKINY
jgi:hypothetical protein